MPSKNNTRLVVAAAVLLLAAVLGYWYASPYLELRSMARAAQEHDADAFNRHVDYPKLRDSLKGQFGARMAGALGKQDAGGNVFAQAGTAIGAMLGMAFADKFIDAMVRPETVMAALAQAKLPDPVTAPEPEGQANPPPPARADDRPRVQWSVQREGANRVVARGTQPDGSLDRSPALVFDRSGFATWKLTGIRLPASP